MIALDQSNAVAGNGSLFTFPHTCTGLNLAMMVAVCYIPNQDQSVQSVTYGGVPMTKYGETRIRNDVAEEFWYVVGPPVGLADISVVLTASAETTCASASFTGVNQTNPIYFRVNGVGDMVEAIPLTVQAQNGDMLFGFGACSGTSEAPIMPWQTSVWNRLQGSVIRSQGICSFPNFTAQITVNNTVDPPARWACDIVGVRAA